jgi:sestrin
MNLVMRASGPLPLHMRNYIAIVAASQFRCQYLVSHQEQEFLQNGGEATWLKGIDHVPKKISNLLEINAILAHEPWKITRDHVAVVVKGTDAWSIGELVHGLVIMATFRSLAGLVFGCGVAAEVDLALPDVEPVDHGYFTTGDYAASPRSRRSTASVGVNPMHETVKILQALKEASPSPEPEPPLHTKRIVFENAGSEDPLGSDDEDEDEVASGSTGGSTIRSTRAGKLSRFLGPYRRTHTDFDVHAKDYGVFRVQDYSWKEHGYALVSRFYEDAAPLLDDQFDHIYYMTYHTISSHTDVDTAPFRESIWYYVHRIQGLLHEDYDYRNVRTRSALCTRSGRSRVLRVTLTP